MGTKLGGLQELIAEAKGLGSIRISVVNAAQRAVLETVREAQALGLAEPLLLGDPTVIRKLSEEIGWQPDESFVIPAEGDADAAKKGVRLVREGRADAVMKGYVHTDTFMRALLHEESGLRAPGRRVSHDWVVDVPTYPKLLHITDVAINIAPDLNAKAQIIQNAVEVTRLLGVQEAKVAVLSAVETVNPAIASTLDAACLTLMARRGQISGAIVDGPLAFDNAISAEAARKKGIASEVSGDVDILLVPDLVSGNILAKNLEYLAGATAAGIVVGLSAPVLLNSRADPPRARLAAIALAVLMYRRQEAAGKPRAIEVESVVQCSPQPEHACCPLEA